MEIVIDYWGLIGFAVSLPILLVMKRIYGEDSSVESTFFTIDTARSMRFVFGYLFLLEVGVLGFVFLFPIMLMALLLVFGAILIFLFNLLLLLLAIFVSIITFGGSFDYKFSNFGFFDAILGNVLSDYLFGITYSSTGIIVGIISLYLIAPLFSAYNLGKYVESGKAATLTELSFHLILSGITILLILLDPINDFSVFTYPGLLVLHWIISKIGISRAFAWKESKTEYNLPDIIRYKKFITFIFGIPGLIILSSLYFSYIDKLTGDYSDNLFLVQRLLMLLPSILASFLAFLYFLRGDHPLEIRIEEIDTREDLIELAKEFRDLDPSKMDEYMRKRDSQIRYI